MSFSPLPDGWRFPPIVHKPTPPTPPIPEPEPQPEPEPEPLEQPCFICWRLSHDEVCPEHVLLKAIRALAQYDGGGLVKTDWPGIRVAHALAMTNGDYRLDRSWRAELMVLLAKHEVRLADDYGCDDGGWGWAGEWGM